MRIIVNGQQAFGRAVLEALLDRGEDVVGVYTAPDREGRPPDPVKACAVERGIPVFQPKSFRRPEVWDEMRALAPDLGVMAYVTLFVPEEALGVPKLGTIQYHPSLLPMHKGPSSINWPIIFGETKTGLSIFWPDDGLDTGPILLRKEVEIGPDDTLGSIYFNHLFPMGVEAMLEGVDLVRDGKAPKEAQETLAGREEMRAARERVRARKAARGETLSDEPELGTYEGWCRPEDAEIDWTRPAREVYNLIRGANPQPGAWTRRGGKRLQVFDSRRADGAGGDGSSGGGGAGAPTPGEVTAVDGEGFVVAAAGGAVRVERVRPEGGAKMPAGEFAADAGLEAGDRFESTGADE